MQTVRAARRLAFPVGDQDAGDDHDDADDLEEGELLVQEEHAPDDGHDGADAGQGGVAVGPESGTGVVLEEAGDDGAADREVEDDEKEVPALEGERGEHRELPGREAFDQGDSEADYGADPHDDVDLFDGRELGGALHDDLVEAEGDEGGKQEKVAGDVEGRRGIP